MVIYEVNLIIKTEIYENYYSWLLQHIQKLLTFDGFNQAEIGLVEQANTKEKHLRVNYIIQSYQHLENYLKNHATAMRAEGVAKFGNQFSASRRIIAESVIIKAG
jgi:hypothetical protein